MNKQADLFEIIKCSDYCEKVADGTHDSPKVTESGKLLVTSKNIKNSRLTLENAYFISLKDFDEINKRSKVDKWDLLLTMIGTVGEVCIVKDESPNFAIKNVGLLKTNNELKSKWLYYYLRSSKGKQALNERQKGTTQAYLALGEIRNLPIPKYKDSSLTYKAVKILDSLDSKIDLLKEINLTLESIAQAIFKSWFVDFDPVHAKQQGKECAGIDKATADLFPNSFVESELGLIPKDWKVASIKDICEVITNGGTPSRSNALFWENGTIPWYKTGELTDSFLINHSENITQLGLEKSSVKLMEKDSVLMAIYAAPTVGRLGILTQASTFNQATTGMKAKQEIGFVFLYLTLLYGRAWFNNRANGAAQQNISKAIVESYKFVLPTTNILTSFNNSLMPIFKKIKQNINQIQSLSNLRDTLLPRLISGKLDLSKIEEQLEGVT